MKAYDKMKLWLNAFLTLSLRQPFKFKIPRAGSFKNLMEIAELYYSIRTAGGRGRGV
jgi:hypothetical protein